MTTATTEASTPTSTLPESSLLPPSQLEMTTGTMSDVGSLEPATLDTSNITVDLSVTRSTDGGSLSSDPSTTLTIIIACAVAGAVLMIAAAVGLILWLVRRRRRVAGASSGGTPGMDMPVIATPSDAPAVSTSTLTSVNYGILPADRPHATYASSADFPRSTASGSGHYDVLSPAEAAEKLQY